MALEWSIYTQILSGLFLCPGLVLSCVPHMHIQQISRDSESKAVLLLLLFFFFFLGLHPLPMEVPRLGVQSELWLLPYTTAIATQDPSHVCNLHHGSWQCQILNPLSEARARTCILMDASHIH